jgi:hypothetical protein
VLAWLGGGFDKMVGGIIYVIFLALINLFSWIVGFAGALLNFVMKYTILDMTAVIKGGVGVSTTKYSGLTGLNVSWKIIRDLMNVAFVFLLIYEGIQLILDIGSLQNIKKLIFGIVLASLLINFSLFFTEVLIDASNIVTTGIYNSIIGPVPNGKDYGQFGISDAMMQALGLSSIWGDDGKGGVFVSPSLGDGPGQILISGVGLVSIMLVSAFIFFAVSIMFIVRFLTLIFLLMLSPIAYMGLALPSMRKYADEWWESLKGQLLFAPIYMVMTLIVLKMIASPGFITGASFAEVTNHDAKVPSTGYINLILNFVVIIGLLIASLVTSKKWASMGSKHIGTATKSLTSFAGGAVFGGAARLSRNTIGRAGNALANNEKVKDMAVNGNILTRNFAKAGIATGNKASTSTLDVRGSRVFETISKQAGMKDEFGKVDRKNDNFKKIRDEQIKKEVDDAKKYKPSDAAVDEAKARLDSREFKDAEEKRAKERKEYLESEAYLTSDEKRKETEMEDANRRDTISLRDNDIKIRSSEDSIKKLKDDERKQAEYIKNQLDMGLLSGDELKIQEKKKNEIKEKLKRKEQELELQEMQKKNLAEFIAKRELELKNIAHEKENYMSEEKKRLIAMAGGQKTKDDNGKVRKNSEGKVVDQYGNVVNENKIIESTYSQRLETRAKREEAGVAWRLSANTVGTPLSIIIPIKPKTKSDRSEIARQIRKLKSGKTPEQEAAEALNKLKKAAEAKGDKTFSTEEETPAQPVTPTPAEGTAPTS